MSQSSLERFLAVLYTDPEMQARFLADPARTAHEAGLSASDRAAVCNINPTELRIAARSFAHKRRKLPAQSQLARPPRFRRWLELLRRR